MFPFQWLQEWYKENCFHKWEQRYGLKIETLANPGWSIKIDLTGTPLEEEAFEKIIIDRDQNDWIHCWTNNNVFEGRGGINNLEEIVTYFKGWALKNEALEILRKERAEMLEEAANEGPPKWILVKRFNKDGLIEYNRVTQKDVLPPYIHEDIIPGGVRSAEEWEIPKKIQTDSLKTVS